jgi:hypothetical protein
VEAALIWTILTGDGEDVSGALEQKLSRWRLTILFEYRLRIDSMSLSKSFGAFDIISSKSCRIILKKWKTPTAGPDQH